MPRLQIHFVNDTGGRHLVDDDVTLALDANTFDAQLTGTLTVTAVNGVASFDSVLVTKAGRGLRLTATGLDVAGHSAPFHIALPMSVVATGAAFSCASSLGDGTYCWGLNNASQLGNGTTTTTNVPVPVTGGLSYTGLHAGGGHTCAVAATRVIHCWGPNGSGELGNGSTLFSRIPTPVSGGAVYLALSDGGHGAHTCAIQVDSAGVCWGRNNGGQLGAGTMTNFDSVPVLVSGALKFGAMTTGGGAHSCGIATDSSAHCWGFNDNGRLGIGVSGGNHAGPTAVAGGLRFIQISAGAAHTCAISASRAAYCWGAGADGILGNGGTADSPEPVLVLGDLQFTMVNGGLWHNCGLTTEGVAYCWGSNSSGQLGSNVPNSAAPARVSGSLTFTSLSAGQFHTCGVATTGGVYCWGSNATGQLGDGTNTSKSVPTLVHLVP